LKGRQGGSKFFATTADIAIGRLETRKHSGDGNLRPRLSDAVAVNRNGTGENKCMRPGAAWSQAALMH
jgi:hypothetical protein